MCEVVRDVGGVDPELLGAHEGAAVLRPAGLQEMVPISSATMNSAGCGVSRCRDAEAVDTQQSPIAASAVKVTSAGASTVSTPT